MKTLTPSATIEALNHIKQAQRHAQNMTFYSNISQVQHTKDDTPMQSEFAAFMECANRAAAIMGYTFRNDPNDFIGSTDPESIDV